MRPEGLWESPKVARVRYRGVQPVQVDEGLRGVFVPLGVCVHHRRDVTAYRASVVPRGSAFPRPGGDTRPGHRGEGGLAAPTRQQCQNGGRGPRGRDIAQ